MSRSVRSARGVMVDFDELRIKEQMGGTAPAATIQLREDFIDARTERKSKRLAARAKAMAARTVAEQKQTEEVAGSFVIEGEELEPDEFTEHDTSVELEEFDEQTQQVVPKKKVIKRD